MFHNPNEAALLQSAGSGMEGVISPESSSLMIPVVGPSGEVMYYLPAANSRINGAMPLASAGQQQQLPPPLRFDQLQLPSFLQQHQQQTSPETLLMRSISGNLVPFCGNTTSSYTAGLEQIAHQNLFAGGFSTLGGQQLTQKSTIHQQNLEMREIMSQVEKQKFVSNDAQSKQEAHPGTVLPGGFKQITSETGSENFLESGTATCVTTTTVVLESTEKNRATSGSPRMANLGPVEKAVFQQALFNQTKKRNPGTGGIGESGKNNSQVQSGLHLKSKKHSRAMFDSGAGKDKVLAASTSAQVVYPASGLKKNADIFQLADTTSTSHDSRALKCDSGAISPAIDPTRLLDTVKPDPLSPALTTLPTTNQHLVRSSQQPAIRYHPYIRSQDSTKLDEGTRNGLVSVGDSKISDRDDSTSELALAGNAKDKNCFHPSIHVPTSTCEAPSLGDVHSVTVPKSGSYKLPTKSQQPPDEGLLPNDDVNTASKSQCDNADRSSVKLNEASTQSTENGSSEDIDKTDNLESTTQPHGEDGDPETPGKNRSSPIREVNLPDPLPSYITRMERPPGRVLKESLHCTTCDIYVNSDNQMKQHLSSLRHKNTLQGIPTPPKPGREEKPKPKSEQYRCNICKVTLNSDIQLSQHLASQRHKNILEGKPPKPRWTPYERNQQVLLRSAAALRIPFKTGAKPTLINSQQSLSLSSTAMPVSLPGDFTALGGTPLAGHYLTAPSAAGAQGQLKQASFVLSEGGLLQAREIVYVGAPAMQALQSPAAYPGSIAPLPGIFSGHPQLQLPQVLTAPANGGIDWTTSGLRLAS